MKRANVIGPESSISARIVATSGPSLSGRTVASGVERRSSRTISIGWMLAAGMSDQPHAGPDEAVPAENDGNAGTQRRFGDRSQPWVGDVVRQQQV